MKTTASLFFLMSISYNYLHGMEKTDLVKKRCKNIKILEKDWKRGGNAALHYDLNAPLGYSNIFAQALHENKDADFVAYLIRCGADVHKPIDTFCYYGEEIKRFCLPLWLAGIHREPAVVKVLIDNDAAISLNTPDRHAVLICFVQNLFSDLDGDFYGVLPFLNAHNKKKKIYECIECIDMLIDRGLPLDNNGSEISRILWITKNGYVTNYSLKDLAELSPLKIAVAKKYLPLIEFFLKKGADPNKKYGGKSARDIAQEKSLLQKGISRIKPKREKNILERALENNSRAESKDQFNQLMLLRTINFLRVAYTPDDMVTQLLGVQRR